MARSIDPVVHAVRGFVPARTDEERFLMRHIEDLARTAQSRGIARYSGFLSDREQELARSTATRKTPSAVCSCSAVHRPVLCCPPTRTTLAA